MGGPTVAKQQRGDNLLSIPLAQHFGSDVQFQWQCGPLQSEIHDLPVFPDNWMYVNL